MRDKFVLFFLIKILLVKLKIIILVLKFNDENNVDNIVIMVVLECFNLCVGYRC